MSQDSELYKALDNILWKDWDPIGVNEHLSARDEYYGYIPTIFDLKIKGADVETIAKKLFEIETARMGLFGNMKHCSEIAEKIIALEINGEKDDR